MPDLDANVPVRFGLVGCGKVAARHVSALSSVSDAELTAVTDSDPVRGREFGERFAVPWYQDYREMLGQESLDVVGVLTPSGTHAEIAITSMMHKKHVLIEKPLALSAGDANRIADTARIEGVNAFVVHQNRFNPPIQRLSQAVVEGRLGRIVLASARVRWCRPQRYYDQAEWRGTWKFDGGVFANQAVHHIDLLLWLVGPVESVFAQGVRAMANIEAEDLGVAVLRFSPGAIGTIEATTCARPHDIESSVSILGEKATVEVAGTHLDRVRVWEFDEMEDDERQFVQRFAHSPNEFSKIGHSKTYEALVEFMKTGHVGCLTTAENGQKSIEVLEAIYESMMSGREVQVRSQSARSKLNMRSGEDGANIQAISERENWTRSADRRVLPHRSPAQRA